MVEEGQEDRSARAVPVFEAENAMEAAALVGALEDAGIPTHVQEMPERGYLAFHKTTRWDDHRNGKRLFVPSDRVVQAREVIDGFAREVRAQGVRRAFQSEEIEDLARDPKPDSEMKTARALRDVSEEERDERLSACVAEWLMAGHPEIKIAQRLAAAGLSEGQATQLVIEVVRERADLFERARRRHVVVGLLIVLAGVALFVAGCALAMIDALIWGAAVVGAGIFTWVRAKQMKNPAAGVSFLGRPDCGS